MQAQDYIFVRAFVPFIASILVKAWKESDVSSDIDLILGGMAALNDEIAWFKKEALKWGVALNSVVPHKANVDYCRYCSILSIVLITYPILISVPCATS